MRKPRRTRGCAPSSRLRRRNLVGLRHGRCARRLRSRRRCWPQVLAVAAGGGRWYHLPARRLALFRDAPDGTGAFHLSVSTRSPWRSEVWSCRAVPRRAPWTRAEVKRIHHLWHISGCRIVSRCSFTTPRLGAMQPTFCAVVEMEGHSVREANVFPTLTVAVGGFVATLAGDCRCGGHQRCHRTRPWRWACYVGMGLAVAAGLFLMP